ncbi:peptidoglycan editing factor PgeF [Nitratifractor sp.]
MNGEKYLQYESLMGYDTLKHLVTLRELSRPLENSMALHTGQEPGRVRRNREELRNYFGEGSRFVSVLQVHGNRVHFVGKAEEHGWRSLDESIRADALVTSESGVVLTILTADCLPILFYDPASHAIGAAHAGWKGSAASIAVRTVEVMSERFGSRPEEIVAVIGPGIGGCCYEVSEELADAFSAYPEALSWGKEGRPHLDLAEVNRRQLEGAGLHPERIEVSPHCTACESDRFFSYRQSGGCAGRFLSAIMLKERKEG